MSVVDVQVDIELDKLINTKENLKNVINANGGVASDNFSTYPAKFQELLEKSNGGGSGGIEIPTVSNVSVSEDGVLSFDAPDLSDLTVYEVVYIIKVNENTINTSLTSLNIRDSLVNGSNTISIIAIVTFNDGEVITSLEFEKELIYSIHEAPVTLPYVNSYASGVAIGNYIYIFGGNAGTSPYNQILRYNASTNEAPITMNVTLPKGLKETSAVAIDGKAYIFGGHTGTTYQNTILCYDPDANLVTEMGATLSEVVSRTSAVAIDGKAYIFGGWGGSVYSVKNYIQCYDPEKDKVTEITVKLPNATYSASAVAIDGKAYIFGGAIMNGSLNTILCYDPKTNEITTKGGMLEKTMSETSAVAIDGKAYIFGGWSRTNIIQRYDIENDLCITLDIKLKETMYSICAVALNRIAYLFGGFTYIGLDIIQVMTIS